jgi:hypothetical protein
MSTTAPAATETELERQVREEQQAHDDELKGQDAEKGKLFEVPRVAVIVDESDPGVLKLKFGGQVELDRTDPGDVQFFNGLKAGKVFDLQLSGYVTGSQKTHRHDSEGNVDAIVETKSLVINSVEVE